MIAALRSKLLDGRMRSRVNRLLARADLELVTRQPLEHLEEEFVALRERCAPFTMTSPERMYAMWQATNHVIDAGIPGDIVECGVWRGGSSMLAAETLLHRGDADRALWLYDTFEGMSEPTARDVEHTGDVARRQWESSQREDVNDWCFAPVHEVEANLRSTGIASERVHLVRGKVEDTIPGRLPQRVALLRLDTDWYESTLHELENLYPLLEPGGVLIVDDYGHWEGARDAVDEYFARTGSPILLNRIDYTGRIGIKPA